MLLGEDVCAHFMLSLNSQGYGAGAANASFRVTLIVRQLFGAKLHPINEPVILSELRNSSYF